MADFASMVARRRDACVQFKEGEPAKDRRQALRFYRGDNLSDYGDSGDGLSTVVSRDVMEAVESILPPLIKSFVATQEVVRFDPVGPEDEDGAAQATDYVNFVFTTHNNAFGFVHDSMKDGLLFRLGVAKAVVEEVEDGAPETFVGLNAEELAAIGSMGREMAGEAVEDESGLFTVTLAPKKVKRYRVYAVAPDEFLYEERLASLDAASFLGHRKQVSAADLIDMGVDAKKVEGIGAQAEDEERDARFENEDEPDRPRDDLARLIWVDECYVRCEYSGDGVLEWRKVLLAGTTVLSNEAIDDHPFSTWTPVPVPHKLVGMSMFDLVQDVQVNKTAMQREFNNALYLANRPMREVVDAEVNIDDLLNPRVGGIVRVKRPGMVAAMPSGGEAAFSAILQAIEYWDSVREARTGVTRYNQGMDSDSLNKTATGMAIISTASQQRQELIARQFGEFMKSIFRKLLGLVTTHGSKQEVMRLRGKWVQVDPTDWKTGYDMSVAVGLGTNNKQQLVGNLMSLIELDKGIVQLQQGVNGPLLTAANIHEKLKRLVEAMDLRGVEKYYTDPAEAPQEPQGEPQEDPAIGKARIDQETDIAKARIKQETDLEVAAMRQATVVPFGAQYG